MSNFNKKYLPKQKENKYYSCLACNSLFNIKNPSHYCSTVAINYHIKDKYLVIGKDFNDYIKIPCEQEEVQNKINSYIRNLLFR